MGKKQPRPNSVSVAVGDVSSGTVSLQKSESKPIMELVETMAGQGTLVLGMVLLAFVFLLLPHLVGEYIGSLGGYWSVLPFAITGLAFLYLLRKEGLLKS